MSATSKKLLQKVEQTRENWWTAFKGFCTLRGYRYYNNPAEAKYRYPAPGSVAHTPEDKPNLFKNHWKTPWVESEHNIRPKELLEPYDPVVFYSKPTPLDPNNPYHDSLFDHDLVRPAVDTSDWVCEDDYEGKSEEEKKDDLWNMFEMRPKFNEAMAATYSSSEANLDDDYKQTWLLVNERTTNGIDNDKRIQNTFLELEYLIEEVFLTHRKETGVVEMYKGNTKKWQVLDDHSNSRDQIEKIQAAIRAPSPA